MSTTEDDGHGPDHGCTYQKCGNPAATAPCPFVKAPEKPSPQPEFDPQLVAAGDSLALAAAHVAAEYDGVHRLRAALAKWYDVRAGIHGSSGAKTKDVIISSPNRGERWLN